MYDKLLGLLSGGQYSVFAMAAALAILFNATKILSFFDGVKKRRIELLKEATAIPSINGDLKKHLEDELEGEYFNLTHKAKMDKGVRDAAIGLYLKMGRRLPFFHFIRARIHLYLRSEDGKLDVEISKFDLLGHYYNYAFGILMVVIGLWFLAKIPMLDAPTLWQVLILMITCIVSVLIGFFLLAQTFPISSARKIQKLINADVVESKNEGEN